MGCAEVRLSIPAAKSLKEKRSVVRRCVDRVRHRFGISVAETGDQDVHTQALVGFAVVTNDGPFANSVLDKVLNYLDQDLLGRAEVLDSRIELLHV